MPELPEVETVVRQLATTIPGLKVLDVKVIQPDLLRSQPEPSGRPSVDSSIESVTRRGKNILLSLSTPRILVVNLGMTGQLLFTPGPPGHSGAASENPSHPAMIFSLHPRGTWSMQTFAGSDP